MKELLKYFVENIVAEKEQVQITEEESEGLKTLRLKVATEDMGRVIGKDGKVIRALRAALKVAAINSKLRVNLVLDEAENAKI